MTQYKNDDVGKVGWEEDAGSGGAFSWMSLKDGNNSLRIVSNPYRHFVHWVVDNQRQRRKVNCAMDGCPICIKGDSKAPRTRFIVQVLDRADGMLKLLDIGVEIYNGIKALSQNPKWGSIIKYDVSILKGKKSGRVGYDVVPEPPKSKLTKEEKTMIKESREDIDFDKLVAPATPEKIKEVLTGQTGSSDDFDDVDAFDSSEFDDDLDEKKSKKKKDKKGKSTGKKKKKKKPEPEEDLEDDDLEDEDDDDDDDDDEDDDLLEL